MADDYQSRYRSSHPYGQPSSQGGHASDPLAELARLIGQSDPFAEFNREARPAAAPYEGRDYAANHDAGAQQQGWQQPYLQDYGGHPYSQNYETAHSARPESDWQHDYAHARQQYARDYDSYGGQTPVAPGEFDPFAPGHAAPTVGASAGEPPVHDASLRKAFQASHQSSHFETDLSGRHEFQPEGSLPPSHGEEFYEDAPTGRRKGLVTVAAVLGLAVLGTAGAFAYRSIFLPRGTMTASPPVIRASSEPTKVAPPPANADPNSGKISYDRFATAGQNERVAVREEAPAEIDRLVRGSAPSATIPPPTLQPPATTPAANNPPSVLTEPRRVRTERIRADQPEGTPAGAMPPPAAATPSSVARQTPMASLPPAAETQTDLQRPSSPAARTAGPRTRHQTPPPAANAPLSLNPNATAALPPSTSAEPPPRSPRGYRVAGVTAGRNAGGGAHYHVQVSSQRSEADAQSAFRSLQSRFANVLGGQHVVIRRADLGQRGVYYRAMVGPFATREQAIQLCSSLKSAGGDCVVQSN